MKSTSSSEFRKTYARLDETTEVTVNGHVIGRWVPMEVGTVTEWTSDSGASRTFLTPVVKTSQAQRDAILRRIAKQ